MKRDTYNIQMCFLLQENEAKSGRHCNNFGAEGWKVRRSSMSLIMIIIRVLDWFKGIIIINAYSHKLCISQLQLTLETWG